MLELAILIAGAAAAAAFIFLPNALQALQRRKRRNSSRAVPTAPALRVTTKPALPSDKSGPAG